MRLLNKLYRFCWIYPRVVNKWRSVYKKNYFYLNFLDLNIDFFISRCFSTNDFFAFPLNLCFNIIKFFFFSFSLFDVLANSFILLFLEPNLSRPSRPVRTVARRASYKIKKG